MEGIVLAMQSDCALVVKMMTSKERDRSYLGHLIAQVKSQLASNLQVCIVKIPRTQNKASYALARFSRAADRTAVWLGSGPDECLGIVILMLK
jgi:hypothetical protein